MILLQRPQTCLCDRQRENIWNLLINRRFLVLACKNPFHSSNCSYCNFQLCPHCFRTKPPFTKQILRLETSMLFTFNLVSTIVLVFIWGCLASIKQLPIHIYQTQVLIKFPDFVSNLRYKSRCHSFAANNCETYSAVFRTWGKKNTSQATYVSSWNPVSSITNHCS